jgi:hypothetical protein
VRTGIVAVLVAAGVPLAAGPAHAAPAPDYEMPFTCGQSWTGSTRPTHSPSALAVDFNRVPDEGQLTVASASGTVARVEHLGNRSYGTFVVVDHGGGESSWYAHLQSAFVTVGAPVDQGMVLGRVGRTGNVTGPHLHFERRAGSRVAAVWFHGNRYRMPHTAPAANCPDVPIAGDWDHDGKAEVGVYRRGPAGSFQLRRDNGSTRVVAYGAHADLPLVGDWDGDGTDDVGVRRQQSRRFLLRAATGRVTAVAAGGVDERAVTGDWDGDGDSEVGLWRHAGASFWLRRATGTGSVVAFGTSDCLPVTGDWNGDRRSDVGVFRPATRTWSLRVQRRNGTVRVRTVVFGSAATLPVTGDWNGDGRTDLGTWDPATARFTLRTAVPVDGTARTTSVVYGVPRPAHG